MKLRLRVQGLKKQKNRTAVARTRLKMTFYYSNIYRAVNRAYHYGSGHGIIRQAFDVHAYECNLRPGSVSRYLIIHVRDDRDADAYAAYRFARTVEQFEHTASRTFFKRPPNNRRSRATKETVFPSASVRDRRLVSVCAKVSSTRRRRSLRNSCTRTHARRHRCRSGINGRRELLCASPFRCGFRVGDEAFFFIIPSASARARNTQ